MGLSRIDSEINGDFNRNRNFSHSMPLKPLLREFPLEFRNGGSAQKPIGLCSYMTLGRVYRYVHLFRYNTKV